MYDRADVGVVRDLLAVCSLHIYIPLCHHHTRPYPVQYIFVFTADVYVKCSFAVQGLCVGAVVGGGWMRLKHSRCLIYLDTQAFSRSVQCIPFIHFSPLQQILERVHFRRVNRRRGCTHSKTQLLVRKKGHVTTEGWYVCF